MKKVVVLGLIIIMLTTILCGCTSVSLDKNYYQYYYDINESKFVATGSTLRFTKNFTFVDEYNGKNKKDEIINIFTLQGTYANDKDSKIIYATAFDESFDEVIKLYETYLKQAGYSASQIKNMIKSITNEQVYNYYKEFIFKTTSIEGSRMGEIKENLNTIEGKYNVRDIENDTADDMFLKDGVCYEKNPKKPEIFDQKIGVYEIKGNFITITIDKNPDASMKYLIATITILDIKGEDKDGVEISVPSKKIKVFVSDFYTQKKY
ncbi:MAG: hypothetical protein RR123_05050 [Clostridia bacterium]